MSVHIAEGDVERRQLMPIEHLIFSRDLQRARFGMRNVTCEPYGHSQHGWLRDTQTAPGLIAEPHIVRLMDGEVIKASVTPKSLHDDEFSENENRTCLCKTLRCRLQNYVAEPD